LPQGVEIKFTKEVRQMASRKAARSAISGKFVTKKYASQHKKTTVVETIKNPKKK
jgi:hypothetical protein